MTTNWMDVLVMMFTCYQMLSTLKLQNKNTVLGT